MVETVIIVALSVEVWQLLERVPAKVELGVKWTKGIGVLRVVEVMCGDGRHADVIESVNGVNLEFQLL